MEKSSHFSDTQSETAAEASEIDLTRFVKAHQESYAAALREIQGGRKYSHWMWYIFPQLVGLGHSNTSRYYAIHNLEEAAAFLKHPYLGKNLLEISSALLQLDKNNAREIFGFPDDKKLQSCMTLFEMVSGENSVFEQVLKKYFDGQRDNITLRRFGRR